MRELPERFVGFDNRAATHAVERRDEDDIETPPARGRAPGDWRAIIGGCGGSAGSTISADGDTVRA